MPYRDFFEVHFPLVYQILAPVFVIAGDDPTAIVGLRLGMLPFLALACGGVAILNARQGRLAALAAPVLLLALPAFVTLATEIRPDAIAAALFLASLGLLRVERVSDRLCGAGSGFLLAASAWGSQKAAFYGSIFALTLLVDLAARRGDRVRGDRPLLRSPAAFVGGVVAGVAVVAIYLTATGSWAAWWNWCFTWAVEHQRHYPGFPWRRYFDPILVDAPWLFLLAAWGLVRTLRALRERGRDATRDPDTLLVGALVSTFASFALQRAPYPYSFLAFLAIVTVFAGRGVGDLLATKARPVVRLTLAMALLVVLAVQSVTFSTILADSNAAQLDVLGGSGGSLHRTTPPTTIPEATSHGRTCTPTTTPTRFCANRKRRRSRVMCLVRLSSKAPCCTCAICASTRCRRTCARSSTATSSRSMATSRSGDSTTSSHRAAHSRTRSSRTATIATSSRPCRRSSVAS